MVSLFIQILTCPSYAFLSQRLIDKTKVTCLKWLPGSANLFLAAHASGHLYLYNEELPCAPTAPNYQTHKLGEGFTIYTCKSKATRNPLFKWMFNSAHSSGNGSSSSNGSLAELSTSAAINEFCFSPCGQHLAVASQDGFLRVFRYESMELLGIARSYFGGFLCVCWSPDGKYIVVGGEDDLVTMWSLQERRVVARGQGHRSWVSVVAFDPYTTNYGQRRDSGGEVVSDDDGSGAGSDDYLRNGIEDDVDDEYLGVSLRAAGSGVCNNNNINNNNNIANSKSVAEMNNRLSNGIQNNSNISCSTSKYNNNNNNRNNNNRRRRSTTATSDRFSQTTAPLTNTTTSYRLGSVSQDTQLCLWDITEDLLRQPIRPRLSSGDCPRPQQHQHRNQSKESNSNSKLNASQCASTPFTNQEPSLSSLSTASSISSSAAVAGAAAALSTNSKGDLPEKRETKDNSIHNSSGNSNNNQKNKAATTISLIGNCVGNNLHKLTMSSSISSSSSLMTVPDDQKVDDPKGSRSPSDDTKEVTKNGGNSIKTTGKSSSDSSSSQHSSTFNTLTQRLSHFSFGNDKRGEASESGGGHHKKGFTLTKSFGGGSSSNSSE